MKIIEVREGFIKFEADKSICLSSFIQIEGMSKSYIAQVNHLSPFGDIQIASAKILFLYDGKELLNYDKTEPSKDAEISGFTFDILNNSINTKMPVIVGKTLDEAGNLKIDASAFNKKMLISVDDKNMNNTLVRNLSKQFENLGIKTVVIDTLGVINAKKYKAGIDFKLPLNTASLAFMYESCLSDATVDSKSTIVEIFRDLSEYSKTVPFVPFGTLKAIVDEMVDKQHVFKLLVLKNKLAKFEKSGYFATSQEEVSALQKILVQQCAIIDLTGMDTVFQNRYLAYIYENLDENNVQVFLEAANTISKKNLKNVISDSAVPATLIAHSGFQYLNDIKNMFDNFIIEPTIPNKKTFLVYSSFLNSMGKNMYLTAGEATNYIPVISELQIIDEVVEYVKKDEITDAERDNIDKDSDTENSVDGVEQTEIADTENVDDELAAAEEIINISIDDAQNAEDEEIILEDGLTKAEVLAAIDKQSESILSSIEDSYEESKSIDLFESDNEDSSEEKEVTEQVSEDGVEDADEEIGEVISQGDEIFEEPEQSVEDENIELQESDSNDTLAELEKQFDEEDEKASLELSDVNEGSVNIGDIPDENLVVEDDTYEVNQEDVPMTELSEEMLDDNSESIMEELSESESDSDIVEEEINESEAENLSLENESEEMTIELDNDVNMLIEDTNTEEQEDDLPQNTKLDVDFSETKIMPLTGEAYNHDFDEIAELDSSDVESDDIIVDMSDDEQINIDETREQEILEEVDKVYTTMKEPDELEEISDSDLDLIDELNNDGDELEEYHGELDEISDSDGGIIEEVHKSPEPQANDAGEILEHKESSTPIVPLYDADIPQEDMVMSDSIQQGDAVLHAKYGNGVVEKMIKYGSKTLYAINFENIGRRLLDPTLTEIKRV